ncbi:tripartite tricarboxylate transporter substrate binding protein BugD [Burkholderiaceae bacterium FT117]|uniref:tripartite tricarboxylate transporter substrate binding protein BugD n=1 Tax=Zeimonas sediminis TaxID=2944268 RepID=UPI002342D118|nr:tripartite tricarboxylate transporter substrate binding protein BugD [Zeimonas sediminis]MCM5570797.1 tripartite tricarboxylate transporter substrate binding protein BugD [Zeimonas sediminis]
MSHRRPALKRLVAGLAGAAAVLSAAPAFAQDYPTRAISITVPFAAGGPTDTVARTVADAMAKAMPGANFVVENAAGAGGTIGVGKVARAKPDGYSLLVFHIGMATQPSLYRKLQYKPLEDFEFIGMINEVPMTIMVKNDLPAKNMAELVPYLKANASKVTLANAGIGAASHLCGLMFQAAISQELVTVPYKGTAPAMADLMGGQVDLLCDQTTNTTPQIKGGKVKAIAITSPKRIPSLPDVPTMIEQGYKDFDISIWHGMYAPKGTPKAVIDKLVAGLQQALKDENLNKRFADLGATTVSTDRATPEALRKHLASEIDRWRPVIQKAGVYAD